MARPDLSSCETWLVPMDDGAEVLVRTVGSGPAMLLVHGWSMSGAFWARQLPLARRYRLILPDLRSHGDSPDYPDGHTVPRYARDLERVAQALELKEFLLAGWSMAGPIVLECWRIMRERIRALALVEMTTYPCSGADWNTHGLRGCDPEAVSTTLSTIRNRRQWHIEQFVRAMFYARQPDESDCAWMIGEASKTPVEAAATIYGDYVVRDYDPVLAEVDVPALAAFGHSRRLCFGPETGHHVATSLPHGELEMFNRSAHMPFWDQAARFNASLERLAERAGMG